MELQEAVEEVPVELWVTLLVEEPVEVVLDQVVTEEQIKVVVEVVVLTAEAEAQAEDPEL
jgi:hypothetical protein